MSIQEEDPESWFPKEEKFEDLNTTHIIIDDILSKFGGFKDEEDKYLNFDNEFQRK